MIVKAKGEIILRASAPAALTPTTQGRAKAMIYADVQVVAATVGGSKEMEILGGPRQIWHRDIRQQTCGNGINLRNRIVGELRAAGGIENLHMLPGVRTGSV